MKWLRKTILIFAFDGFEAQQLTILPVLRALERLEARRTDLGKGLARKQSHVDRIVSTQTRRKENDQDADATLQSDREMDVYTEINRSEIRSSRVYVDRRGAEMWCSWSCGEEATMPMEGGVR